MDRTLNELRIGTYNRICTITEDAPIIQALRLFVQNRVSALPVVNSVTGEPACLLVWAASECPYMSQMRRA